MTWGIKMHTYNQILLALYGDRGPCIWNCQNNCSNHIQFQKPTDECTIVSGNWLSSDVRKFIIGINGIQNYISIYDATQKSQSPVVNMKYNSNSQYAFSTALQSHELISIVLGGFEDGAMRVFDTNMKSCVLATNSSGCRNDSITGIKWCKDGNTFISSSLSGKIRVWDLRMFGELQAETQIRDSNCKDLGVSCMHVLQNQPYVLSGKKVVISMVLGTIGGQIKFCELRNH